MSFEAMSWVSKVSKMGHQLGELDSTAMFTLYVVANRVDDDWSWSQGSTGAIAEEIGQSVEAVEQHLSKLMELGVVVTRQRYSNATRKQEQAYALREEALEEFRRRFATNTVANGGE